MHLARPATAVIFQEDLMRILSKLLVLGAALAVPTTMAYADTLGPGTIQIASEPGEALANYSGGVLTFTGGDAAVDNATGSLAAFYTPSSPGTQVSINSFTYSPYSGPTLVYWVNGSTTLDFYLTSITSVNTTGGLVINGDGYFVDPGAGITESDASYAFSTQPGGSTSFSITSDVTPTPEPGSLMLLGTGLLSAAGIARRKFASKLV
jgi:hypothetical protein